MTPSGLTPALVQAVRAFLYLYLGLTNKASVWPALNVQVGSEFPHGAGLGSSAAFSVSLTAALMQAVTGRTPDKKTVSDWAFRCEHIFHGSPSGIDNSICSFGGAILFQKGTIVEQVSDMKAPPALLVHTNVTRNTKLLVESVTRRRERVSLSHTECVMFNHVSVSGSDREYHACDRRDQRRVLESDEKRTLCHFG